MIYSVVLNNFTTTYSLFKDEYSIKFLRHYHLRAGETAYQLRTGYPCKDPGLIPSTHMVLITIFNTLQGISYLLLAPHVLDTHLYNTCVQAKHTYTWNKTNF